MLNLKKTAVAVLAFGSSAVFAGTMGPVCVPGNVTVPCEATAWDFGAQALYLKPAYAGAFNHDTAFTTNGFTQYQNNGPDWGWGFKIEGSYHYGTGNDVDLNWYHLSKATDSDVQDNFYFGTLSTPDSLALDTKPQWDAVNLEFGQHVDFSDYSKIRFHAGAQYARIKSTDSIALVNSTTTATRNLSYNGFGPRVGTDMSLNWGNGISIYGDAAASVLVGTSHFSGHDGFAPGVVEATGGTYGGKNTAMVPELEAKLGATYTWAMAAGDMTIDAGYMWINYFNAHSFPVSTGSAITEYPAFTSTNFGLSGVYAGLKWVGNVA